MTGLLSPSVMCADLLNLSDEIKKLDSLGVEFLHIDFMDNKFVPNITFDTNMIRGFKKVMNNIKRDIHIMAIEPQQYFEAMEIGKGDMISVHYEACDNPHDVISIIKASGADACLAISPDTSIEVVEDYLDEVSAILLMTVYPGFAGQPMASGSMERLSQLRELIDKSGKPVLIEVDGHVSWDYCQEMKARGADIFVAGSSSVYGKEYTLDKAVERFYELVR